MDNIKILWADDEIDLLKSQIMFLNNKGYEVIEVTNGLDAVEKCKTETLDVVFLDENMPGLSGLETLTQIKSEHPDLPIVMITKSEEENIMEEAIGNQITDYLIKPVNPNQILLTLKKIIDNTRLVRETTSSNYQQDFQKIFMSFQEDLDFNQWVDVYKRLIYWELNLEKSKTNQMKEVFDMQKQEANTEFCKFVMRNYEKWVQGKTEAPVMSHTLMKEKVLPLLEKDSTPTFFLLIDNLRYDQWKVIQPFLNEYFRTESEDAFYSILPTSTQYSRNAIFSGMLPLEIEKRFPKYWINEEDEGSKNKYEKEFFQDLLNRSRKDIKFDYVKISNMNQGNNLVDNMYNYLNNDLTIIVYNFVDMLSHARTDMEVLRELASDDAAYRSITKSWFQHSPLINALKRIAEKKVKLIIATDHGTIRVGKPSKVVGDRNTTTNLRYKMGKNLRYDSREVYEIKKPSDIFLPQQNISSRYIFAKEDQFFVYPNNYNYYVNYFNNTFQHGGISLEEIIIPFAVLTSK
jgi:CheY-like chemotaxis protein